MSLTKTLEKGVLHYPTLKTVLAVEAVLKRANTPLNKEQIKGRLPTKIHHQTLNLIMDYLDESGKIFVAKDGIIWTHNDSPKFKKLLERSVRVK